MHNEHQRHIARCEQAMKQARWAMALQLRRWRDGDSVCAVQELQNAHDALCDIVGEPKPEERLNKATAQAQDMGSICSRLCLQLKRSLPFVEAEYAAAKRTHQAHHAMKCLAHLNNTKAAISDYEAILGHSITQSS